MEKIKIIKIQRSRMVGLLGNLSEKDIFCAGEQEIRGIEVAPFGKMAFYESKKFVEIWSKLTSGVTYAQWDDVPCLDIYVAKSFDVNLATLIKKENPNILAKYAIDFVFSYMESHDLLEVLSIMKKIGIEEGKKQRSYELMKLLGGIQQ